MHIITDSSAAKVSGTRHRQDQAQPNSIKVSEPPRQISRGRFQIKYLSPDNYSSLKACTDKSILGPHADAGDKTVKMWEWYSGSAALSAYLDEFQISHLPPIDYRYGWNLSKYEHQQQLLDIQITVGVDTVFAAPNCSPW